MFDRISPPRTLAVFAVACAALSAQVASACPTCKDSLTEQYVAAYGYSIMFMMSMPFLIFASLGLYFYWEVCKARKRQQVEAATQIKTDERLPMASG